LKYGNLSFLDPSGIFQICKNLLYLYNLFWMLTCIYHMYCSSSQHPAIHYPWRAVEYNRSDYQRCTCGWNPGLLWPKGKYSADCVGRLRTSDRFQQHHNRVANLGYSRNNWITKVCSTVLIANNSLLLLVSLTSQTSCMLWQIRKHLT
jgi:hypothetical protein